MKDQELNRHWAECPECFIEWTFFSSKTTEDTEIECGYCSKHPKMTSKELLLRRIHVLDNTRANRLPEVLQHLAKHIDLKE